MNRAFLPSQIQTSLRPEPIVAGFLAPPHVETRAATVSEWEWIGDDGLIIARMGSPKFHGSGLIYIWHVQSDVRGSLVRGRTTRHRLRRLDFLSVRFPILTAP